MADPSTLGDEPWQNTSSSSSATRYMPMEANVGDYALFLRKASVEVNYEGKKYFIVPQGAILLIVRDNDDSAAPDFPSEPLP